MAETANAAVQSERWWEHDRVLLRRKVLAIAPVFQILDPQGGSLLYCQQKLFKLKEDIRVYADDSKQRELLTIKARSIIDFSAVYDVVDAQTGEKVGALRRKGLKSMLRDEWEILDLNDSTVGRIQEDGLFWLRRILANWVPQSFSVWYGESQVAAIKQAWNPIVFKAEMDLSADHARRLDRRLAMAAGILLMAIEGRQSS
ncbi:MAG TPA: hypothetical protein DFS52_29230 [Myxococcales bacterium]|jgi:uncharacterized protein YxjI|nr:hypothetical protein [Myxococcales bacterium]